MEEADALTWPPKINKYHILKQVIKKNKIKSKYLSIYIPNV